MAKKEDPYKSLLGIRAGESMQDICVLKGRAAYQANLSDEIILRDFPWPPQSNSCFVTSRAGHRFKSDEYKRFEITAAAWAEDRLDFLRQVSSVCQKLTSNEKTFVKVDMIIAVPAYDSASGSLWTKDNRMKTWDASNRIKAAHDMLSRIIQVPDHYFTTGLAEKVLLNEDEQKHLIFRLSFHGPRTVNEALAEWGIDV